MLTAAFTAVVVIPAVAPLVIGVITLPIAAIMF